MIEIKDKENNIYYKNNPEYFDELVKLFNQYPRHFQRMLAKSKKYLGEWINAQLPLLLDKKYTYNTKLYWIFHNLVSFPICQYSKCLKPFGMDKNVNVVNGYFSHCCNQHAQLDQNVISSI